MKRWQNIVAVGGFLFVLAAVTIRLLRAGTSWADLRDFLPHLVYGGLSAVLIALIFLATLWVGNFLWRGIRRGTQRDGIAEPHDSFAGRWRHAAELAVLSVILGFNWGALSRGPGPFVARRLNDLIDRLGFQPNFGVTLALMFVGNAAVCFAILWGVYLLWARARQKAARGKMEVGK